MTNINTNISLLVFSIFLLLCLSQSATAYSFDEFMSQSTLYVNDDLDVYVDFPAIVFAKEYFTIYAFPDVALDNLSLLLYVDDQLIPHSLVTTLEDAHNVSYPVVMWNVSIEEETSFIIKLFHEGVSLFENSFVISVDSSNLEIVDVSRHVLQVESVELSPVEELQLQEYVSSYLGYEVTPLELEQMLEQGKDAVHISKEQHIVSTEFSTGLIEEKTEVVLSISLVTDVQDVFLIEYIPKEFAASVSELVFSDSVVVLEDDPVILWDLDASDTTQTKTYSVSKSTEVTGNTIALVRLPSDVQKSVFRWNVIVPLLLIPLIALIIIIFSKYQPKK